VKSRCSRGQLQKIRQAGDLLNIKNNTLRFSFIEKKTELNITL
jgi:hypothetical protein